MPRPYLGQVVHLASLLSRISCYGSAMKNGLLPGLVNKQTYVTTQEMRASQLASDVFSTPAMIGLMEGTCLRLVAPYLDENEQTVGIHVDVRHMAPTKIGQSVTVTAELLEVKDKKMRFAVSAVNDNDVKIGEGTHRRAVIHTKQFTNQ
jgi:fluoroacetyl-CoA thioesterase